LKTNIIVTLYSWVYACVFNSCS